MRPALLQAVDGMKAKITWVQERNGWRCVLSSAGLPPHMGLGRTPMAALEDVLRFAAAIGWRR